MGAKKLTSWDPHEVLMRAILDPENEQACWLCQFSLNKPEGYCTVSVPTNFRRKPSETKRYAHILSFQVFKGLVPDGHEVDHLCSQHRCINPDHLEAKPIPTRDFRLFMRAGQNCKRISF